MCRSPIRARARSITGSFITTKNTFRIGNSQFTLTGANKGVLTTIVTDPTTGNQSSLTVPVVRQT